MMKKQLHLMKILCYQGHFMFYIVMCKYIEYVRKVYTTILAHNHHLGSVFTTLCCRVKRSQSIWRRSYIYDTL